MSVVLFGSASEDSLRRTSDVNVMLVLGSFVPEKVELLSEPLRAAQAAVRLSASFLTEGEIPAFCELFPVKYADIASRHRILHGRNPFALPEPEREGLVRHARQLLFDLRLRFRERGVVLGGYEEQLATLISETASPLRAAAFSLCQLRGDSPRTPREALRICLASHKRPEWNELPALVSEAREQRALPPGVAPRVLAHLRDVVDTLLAELNALPPRPS